MEKKSNLHPIGNVVPNTQLAAQVAPYVEIDSICLLRTSARNNHALTAKNSIRIEIQGDAVTTLAQTNLKVIVNLKLEGMCDKPTKNELALEIQATYEVKYTLKGKTFSQAQLDAFGENNGIFNIWPFWREYVQNMTTRMDLPALTLPVRRLTLHKRELKLKRKF